LLLASCAGTGEVKTGLGQKVSLSIGQQALITGEELTIRFEEVKEDSRCPKEMTCIWQGRIRLTVEIRDDNSSYRVKLIQPGLTNQYIMETYQDYQLTFKVEPYPKAGKEIASDEYRLLLTVSK
jgi:hypothetical protein